jgi:hypothetical protein
LSAFQRPFLDGCFLFTRGNTTLRQKTADFLRFDHYFKYSFGNKFLGYEKEFSSRRGLFDSFCLPEGPGQNEQDVPELPDYHYHQFSFFDPPF